MTTYSLRRKIARRPKLADFLGTALGVSVLGAMLSLGAGSAATFAQGAAHFYQTPAPVSSP